MLSLFFVSLVSVQADEYPGFRRFPNWAGDVYRLGSVLMTDGNPYPKAVLQDMCASDPKCDSVSTFDRTFHNYIFNTTWETHLAYNTSVLPQALCAPTTGGCATQTTTSWLGCAFDTLAMYTSDGKAFADCDSIIASYALPPDIIHSECLQNANCIGFRLKQDRTAGELFGKPKHCTGDVSVHSQLFSIPPSQAPKKL
jgi:hypothetical protein